MRNLHLTTPLMRGTDVRGLQVLLDKKGWLTDKPDGVYGVHTAQAVYRAKYWLGYAKGDLNNSAGDLLMAYLTGTKKPSLAMKARTRARMHPPRTPVREKVVLTALSQIGQTERPPNSNRSKFSVWYGIIGPWCAMFVTWCTVQVGFGKAFKKGIFVAYVPYIVYAARMGQNGLSVTRKPVTGDIACYDWNNDGVADHTGYYVTEAFLTKNAATALALAKRNFGPLSGGEFWAIEGNTGVGNDSNGGIVMLRKRNLSNVQTFAHVSG